MKTVTPPARNGWMIAYGVVLCLIVFTAISLTLLAISGLYPAQH
jgi:hypothetical protein